MIAFSPSAEIRWNLVNEEAQFEAETGTGQVLCRVSREFLEDRYGADGVDDCLDKSKEHRDQIQDLCGSWIAKGKLEPDGPLLLRSKDW